MSEEVQAAEPVRIMNDNLRGAWELAVDLGLAAAEVIVEDTDSVCPIHQTKLVEERARTALGWQAAVTCPDADGTCPFGFDSDIVDSTGPELYAGRDVKVETINVIVD